MLYQISHWNKYIILQNRGKKGKQTDTPPWPLYLFLAGVCVGGAASARKKQIGGNVTD